MKGSDREVHESGKWRKQSAREIMERSYTNKIVNKRTMGPSRNCKKICFEKIERLEKVSPLFELFCNIGNYDEQ